MLIDFYPSGSDESRPDLAADAHRDAPDAEMSAEDYLDDEDDEDYLDELERELHEDDELSDAAMDIADRAWELIAEVLGLERETTLAYENSRMLYSYGDLIVAYDTLRVHLLSNFETGSPVSEEYAEIYEIEPAPLTVYELAELAQMRDRIHQELLNTNLVFWHSPIKDVYDTARLTAQRAQLEEAERQAVDALRHRAPRYLGEEFGKVDTPKQFLEIVDVATDTPPPPIQRDSQMTWADALRSLENTRGIASAVAQFYLQIGNIKSATESEEMVATLERAIEALYESSESPE